MTKVSVHIVRGMLALSAICLFSIAGAEEITGRQLAQKVFDRDRGKNSVSTAQMVLVSKRGKKRIRHFTTKRIEENGLETQMTRFTAPADIDGTGFLNVEKPGWETEQFLYLPALKRTRRIVSSQKNQRFVNSDFTYEDMERHPVSDYTYKITGSTTVGNMDCHILESRPKQGVESQYGLTISTISKDGFVPVHVAFYDKKNTHIKTYHVLKLEQVQGIWTEIIISMEDHQKGHKTYIKQDKITYNTNIKTDDVSRKSLENY
ncbi:outer membrane lipoprotein-sorting protein [Desulfobacter latus]|uniref:Outer membrane lipoprotein-sorting protein n=1 Tax=Desulfobacter latus TaxID=2292 RepID=A0A850T041_9BACT|nr:outer membrane lipoprotein-sorting protein [Desulfobacter latus]NWH05063.1 outer membrane lipoprotein-sorting protein [Desulfobacter latus]